LSSPKEALEGLEGDKLERAIASMLEDPVSRERFRIFFGNEYYPAFIPVGNRKIVLAKSVEALIERGAFTPQDRNIISITRKLYPFWFSD
jgi:hypothetical protein